MEPAVLCFVLAEFCLAQFHLLSECSACFPVKNGRENYAESPRCARSQALLPRGSPGSLRVMYPLATGVNRWKFHEHRALKGNGNPTVPIKKTKKTTTKQAAIGIDRRFQSVARLPRAGTLLAAKRSIPTRS